MPPESMVWQDIYERSNRDNFEFPIPHLNMAWPDGNMVHFVCKLSFEVELKAYAKSDGTS